MKDNFYIDVAVNPENLNYQKYIWNETSLEEMAKEAKCSDHWNIFGEQVEKNMQVAIDKEEKRLNKLEQDYKRQSLGFFSLFKKKHLVDYYGLGKQQEIVVFLHRAHEVFHSN